MQVLPLAPRFFAALSDFVFALLPVWAVLLAADLLRLDRWSLGVFGAALAAFVLARSVQGIADAGPGSWSRRFFSAAVVDSAGERLRAAESLFRRLVADAFAASGCGLGLLFASWRAGQGEWFPPPVLFSPADWGVAAFVALDVGVLLLLWARRGGSSSWPHDRVLNTVLIRDDFVTPFAPALSPFHRPEVLPGLPSCGDLAAFARRLGAGVDRPLVPVSVSPAADGAALAARAGLGSEPGALPSSFVLPEEVAAGLVRRLGSPSSAPVRSASQPPPADRSGAAEFASDPPLPAAVARRLQRGRAGSGGSEVPRYEFRRPAGASGPGDSPPSGPSPSPAPSSPRPSAPSLAESLRAPRRPRPPA